MLGALAFMGAVLPTAMSSSPQPQPLNSAKLDIRLLYKTSPVAVVAAFAIGMAGGTFGTLAPVYGFQLGLSPAVIAFIMSVAAIAGAVAQIPLGRLSDVMDRRLVLAGASLLAALVGVALVLLNPQQEWLFVHPVRALRPQRLPDLCRRRRPSPTTSPRTGSSHKIASAMLFIYGIGLAIGPLIASFVMESIGPVGMFTVTATFHGLLRHRRLSAHADARNAVPVEERAPFQSVPLGRHSTPETFAFDPRADEGQAEAEDGETADETDDDDASAGEDDAPEAEAKPGA